MFGLSRSKRMFQALRQCRSHGVTIDVATASFETFSTSVPASCRISWAVCCSGSKHSGQ
jgi:hypothetical protein